LETRKTGGMKLPPDPRYHHRFPAEIITHGVWLYHVFSLSFRGVELLLAERGVMSPVIPFGVGARSSVRALPVACVAAVSAPVTGGILMRCSSGSRACNTVFGVAWIRTVFCSTSSFSHGGMPGREALLRLLLKSLQYVPRVIVTDKLRGYGVAQRQLLPKVEHRQIRYLNNRVENSHRPTRRRERQMQRFKSPGQAQDFLSAHALIHDHFHPRRHLLTANSYRAIRTKDLKINNCFKAAVAVRLYNSIRRGTCDVRY
jgi:putative transposase